MQTTVRKKGRELIWDNVGTHDQVGAINVGFAAWRGAILGSINVLHAARPDGLHRRRRAALHVRPRTGQDHLARLGRGGQPGRRLRDRDGDLARQRAGLEDDAGLERRDDARPNAVTPDGAQWPCHFVAGDNQRGDYYVGGMGDNMLGGGGGTAWTATANSPTATSGSRRAAAPTSRPTRPTGRSSTSSAASTPTPAAPGASAPATAARSPTSRTRASPSSASTPTRGSRRRNGLFGGDPGSIMRTRVIQGSESCGRFAAGEMPQDLDELGGGTSSRSAARATASRSATTTSSTGTGSAAGRLRRPADARPGAGRSPTSPSAARSARRAADDVYGVKLDADGRRRRRGDGASCASAAARTAARGGRGARRAGPPVRDVAGRCRDDRRRLPDRPRADVARAATAARTDLGAADGQPEAGRWRCSSGRRRRSPRATRTRRVFVDDEVVWRDFCCPGCGVRLATEVGLPGRRRCSTSCELD